MLYEDVRDVKQNKTSETVIKIWAAGGERELLKQPCICNCAW